MKLVLATRNRDKTREIADMLSGLDVAVVMLDAFPGAPATEEDGDTLEANALKKAREVRAHTGLSALADDTGLEVAALGGGPGVFAARYAGKNATYAENCAKLLREMAGIPSGARGACFRTVMALALSAGDAARLEGYLARHPEARPPGGIDCLLSEGILRGEIAAARRGDAGFGYDPVFVVAGAGRTLAEMTLAEKNRTSHRYRALVEMRETLARVGLAGPA